MPLTERPDDVRDFLNGKEQARAAQDRKAARRRGMKGDRSYMLWLPAPDMARAKAIAAQKGITMNEFFADAIEKACRAAEGK